MEFSQLIDFVEKLYIQFGLPLVFISSFIEITPFGIFVPGGTIVAIGGFFAFGRTYYLLRILIAGWLGAWSTFLVAYYLGNKTGYKLVKRFKQEKNANRANILLKNHGPAILTTSMLASITRFWISYVAGAQGYPLVRFIFYSGVASLTWTSLMVVIGYLAGSERENLETGLASAGALAWVLFLVTGVIIYLKARKEFQEFKEG